MRIDVFVHQMSGGGAERVASNLASAWAEAGHQVRIVTMSPMEDVEYHPSPQVAIATLATPRWVERLGKLGRTADKLAGMRRAVVSSDADVMLAIGADMAVELGLAGWGLPARIVACEHNIPNRSIRRLWRPFRPAVYRRCAAVVALTERSAEELRRICPGAKVIAIPNPVRLPVPTVPPKVDPSSVVGPGRAMLLAVGRLNPVKGFDTLVRKFARLARERDEVDLCILGEGPLRAGLEALIAEHGLSGRVHLPGRVGNVSDWYGRASVLVMTSRAEGFPMVLLEALAHGLPAVVTDFRDGPREMVEPGVNGFIVPGKDDDLWVSTIRTVLEDDQLRARLSAAARRIQEDFGETPVLARWQALFEQLAAERDRA